jgi:hypothetical protein
MNRQQIFELASQFEIGAHTLGHVFLDSAIDSVAECEITGSKKWVEDITGKTCRMFCPPGGKFDRRHLDYVQAAGFLGIRSVELLSLDWPRYQGGLWVMPTTLQAHPHTLMAYGRNVLKRRAWGNLWTYVAFGRHLRWNRLAESLAQAVIHRRGVFHLWGHSWELEQTSQWRRLDDVLRLLGEIQAAAPCRNNGDICQLAADGFKDGKHESPTFDAQSNNPPTPSPLCQIKPPGKMPGVTKCA